MWEAPTEIYIRHLSMVLTAPTLTKPALLRALLLTSSVPNFIRIGRKNTENVRHLFTPFSMSFTTPISMKLASAQQRYIEIVYI
jgi:hypothetical protein